jgi:hypothetical protein
MTENKDQEKKIIVDEDWKQEAQHEKEILSQKEKEEKEKTKTEQADQAVGPIPKGDFSGLISMLATQALFAMGLLQVKDQPEKKPELQLAKFYIDMLETIEEKTKGNLDEEEKSMLSKTLNDLRMGFVQISNMAEKQS